VHNLILLQNAHGSPGSDKCVLLFVCLYFHENHMKSHSRCLNCNIHNIIMGTNELQIQMFPEDKTVT